MTDPFTREPRSAGERLTQHLQRRNGRTTAADASEQYQTAVLRGMLTVVEMALRDEDLNPAVTRRVLDKVIYGCAPRDYDADERATLTKVARDAYERAPMRVEVTPERFDQLRGGQRG